MCVCTLTPVIALLVVCCFSVGRMLLSFFSSNLDGVDVAGRIGRCFARRKTVRASPLYGENRLEWSNAGVSRRLWSFRGTAVV